MSKIIVHCDDTNVLGKGNLVLSDSNSSVQSSVYKFGTGSLHISSGKGAKLECNTAFVNRNFTIDFWSYYVGLASSSGSNLLAIEQYETNVGAHRCNIGIHAEYTGNNIMLVVDNVETVLTTTSNIRNKWTHFAICRKDNTLYSFVNGILISTASVGTFTNINSFITLGNRVTDPSSLYTYIDEIRIIDGKACWTSNFTPPTAPYSFGEKAVLSTTNTAYGYNTSGTFTQLATDWSTMSSAQRLALMKTVSADYDITVSDLQSIGDKFKIISMQEDEAITSTNLTALSLQPVIAKPKKLISTRNWENINKVTWTSTITDTSGSTKLRLATTTNLTTYKVWDSTLIHTETTTADDGTVTTTTTNGDWKEISVDDILTDGNTEAELEALTTDDWNKIAVFGEKTSGIAFAYGMNLVNTDDSIDIDKLEMNVDMVGTWNKAVYNTDVTYCYPTPEFLQVAFKTAGTYKVNYSG